ncbi:MAG TPA: hypothetical protein VGL23_12730 [Chloroflexota bacterium]
MRLSRLSRRDALRLTGAGAGALVLAACGGGSAAPTASAPTAAAKGGAEVPAKPAEPAAAAKAPAEAPKPAAATTPAAAKPAGAPAAAEVTFWGHNHVPRVELDKEVLATFLKENASAKVEYVAVPQEYEVKLTAAMASGTGPDGYNISNGWSYPYMAKGLAAELDPTPWGQSTAMAVANLYVDGAHEGHIYQGKLYGVVSEYSNYSMFWNTKIGKAAGLDLEKEPPKSWDDVVEYSKKMVKREGDTLTQRGFDFTYMTQQGRSTSPVHTLLGMAYQLGGEFFTSDRKATSMNSEPFIRAMQFQQDFIYKEKLGSPALLGSNGAFREGTVAGSLVGFWFIPQTKKDFPDVGNNFTVKPFPQMKDAKRKSGAAVYTYGRMVNSKSNEAARTIMWKLHKAWADNPGVILDRTGLLQPKKDFVSTDAFKKIENLPVFLDDAVGSTFSISHNNSIEITNALIRAMERITQEKADVKTSLEQGKKEIDDIISKG